MKQFPKTVYITKENEGTKDEYLNIAIAEIDVPFDDSGEFFIAVYELKQIKKANWELKLDTKVSKRK